ncbi:hypothetical protein [Sphingosinicella rhizophila]|uniref:Secreted protein n=1 Tax=Sphingosinicella rhizophila TaxID=3050082 RepID=A0ABU3Q441_9SPHN|nr:hypothetical protein [Sphingosinicella sp. GR2756]MDT9598169.1 hypothetical protein [Sphingosinicella sp. GR2756]
MRTLFKAATLIVATTLSYVPATAQPTGPEDKISRVIVYGNDPCPQSVTGEVVVCARRPDTERFRIPETLRESSPGPEGDSWAVRAESLEYVGRTGTQSCSTVGPGGFTGCWEQMMRAAREDQSAGASSDRVPEGA